MPLKIILSTIDKEHSQKLASDLVHKHLAACVNIIGPLRSIYVWQDEVCDDEEYMLLIKTTQERADDCFQYIKDNHPYDVPEIVEMQSQRVLESYLQWAQDMCST